MSKKIAIIGAGNIGSRYIESIVNSDIQCELYIVDINSDSLDKIKNYK